MSRVSRRALLQWGAGAALAMPAAGLLSACGGGSPSGGGSTPGGKKGGHLVFGLNDITSLNPMLTRDLTSHSMARLLFDPLVQIDDQQNPIPMLAQSAPQVSSDGLTYTFKLRQGVKWSDGQPLTADDVVWSYQLAYDPRYEAVTYEYRGQAEATIESVTAPDPQTIVIKTKAVYAPFLTLFGILPIMPKHVLGGLDSKGFNTADFNSKPTVVSGAFKPVEWKKGAQLTLARNDDYYRGAPLLDGIVSRVITGDATSSLLSGEIDMSDLLVPADLNRLSSGGDVSVRKVAADMVLYARPNLDPAKPGFKLFGDKRVRQALLYALDRQSMVNAIFFDKTAVVANSIWTTGWAYDPEVSPRYSHQPSKAGAMLDAAGWRKGASGTREKDGLPMKFDMMVPSSFQAWVQVVEAIQQQWKAIGVDMNVVQIDHAAWIQQLSTTRSFDMIVDEAAWGGYDPDPSRRISSEATQPNGGNGGDYKSPQVDALLNRALETVDKSKRKQIYAQLQNVVMDDLPFLPILSMYTIWGVSNRLRGVQLGGWSEWINWHWLKDVSVTQGK